jgi:hypothetical protein
MPAALPRPMTIDGGILSPNVSGSMDSVVSQNGSVTQNHVYDLERSSLIGPSNMDHSR